MMGLELVLWNEKRIGECFKCCVDTLMKLSLYSSAYCFLFPSKNSGAPFLYFFGCKGQTVWLELVTLVSVGKNGKNITL